MATNFNPLGAFTQGKSAGLGLQQQQLGLQQAQAQAPRQNILADLQVRGAQRQFQQEGQQQGVTQETSRIQFMNRAGKALLQIPPEQREAAFSRLEPLAQQVGIEPGTFTAERMTDESLNQLIATTDRFSSDPQTFSAAQREFEALAEAGDFSPEQRAQAARVKARIEAPPTGAAPQIVDIGGVPHIFDKQKKKLVPAEVEGKRVTVETIAKSQSNIKAAQSLAVDNAKNLAKEAQTDKTNAKALNVYDVAMSGLVEALGGTLTGPIAGFLPALTTNQQIADGSVAAIAPILKQMFRSAGEGTFTDQDQKLLTAMIPTRKDSPGARAAKLKNIDAIIRAKLGSSEQGAQQFTEGQTASNQQGQSIVFRNGQWVPQ
jgi:hypothetical protein